MKGIMERRQIAESIQTSVESIMHSPRPPGRLRCFGSLLFLFSIIYGGGAKLRRDLYRSGQMKIRRLPVPVICVGNLAVGGTGKTPMVMHIARLVQNMGFKPVIVSRGYKGRGTRRVSIVGDGRRVILGPDEAGDEPVMLATHLSTVPVVVGRDRHAAGTLAVDAFDPDVILLDDGFQHLGLARDLNLVLLDASEPFGNGYLLPRGILREPICALADAHSIVLTRQKVASQPIPPELALHWRARPIFEARHRPYLCKVLRARRAAGVGGEATGGSKFDLADLAGKRVYLFSGIGRNDDFRATVMGLGCRISGHLTFADHHRYSAVELAKVAAMAVHLGCECLMTTEKDYVRIGKRINHPLDLVVLGIEMEFPGPGFENYIHRFLAGTIKPIDRS
jgi:tetraacyldisaccharide 4'-kinase